MYLQVNGTRFITTDTSNPFKKVYNECMKELGKLGMKNIIFESAPHKITKHEDGNLEYSSGGWVNYHQKFMFKDQTFDVRCYDTSFYPPNRINTVEEFRPRHYNFPGNIDTLILKNDPEKVFFLIFVSENCARKPELEDLQNKIVRDKRNTYYKLRDVASDAKSAIKVIRDAAKLTNMLMTEGVMLPIDQVKIIGRSVGMGGFDGYGDDQIRIEVSNHFLVKKGETWDPKRIDEFFRIAPANGKIEDLSVCRALVEELKDKKLIVLKETGGKLQWQTSAGNVITSFATSQEPVEMLANFFKEHPEEREMFEQIIEDSLIAKT